MKPKCRWVSKLPVCKLCGGDWMFFVIIYCIHIYKYLCLGVCVCVCVRVCVCVGQKRKRPPTAARCMTRRVLQ